MSVVEIDAHKMHYTPLNKLIRKAVKDGAKEIHLRNVMGQRFIGDGLTGDATITVEGVPGGDLGMFMKGRRSSSTGMLTMLPEIPWMRVLLSSMAAAEMRLPIACGAVRSMSGMISDTGVESI